MTEIPRGTGQLGTFDRLNGWLDVPKRRFHLAPPKSLNQRTKSFTFSCDIAYSRSATASRASASVS